MGEGSYASLPSRDNVSTPDEPVSHYSDGLHRLAPWSTPELPQLKGKGRRLERLCRKTGLAVRKSPYNQQMCHYKDAPSAAKSESSPTLIRCSKGNSFVL